METDQGQAHLVMLKGPHPEKVFQLSEGEITVGRELQNAIVISDPEISRRHARLQQAEQGYTVEDLGSTNGTFVNGVRITRGVQLTDGDKIALGETVQFAFHVGVPPRERTVVSGVGTVTPPIGEPEMPDEPMAEIEIRAEPPAEGVPPSPVDPIEPPEQYEAQVLEPPPPFDEPVPPATGAERQAGDQEQDKVSPPQPESPFEIEPEVHRAPSAPFEPGLPPHYPELPDMTPPPAHGPSQLPVREPGPPSGEPFRQHQPRETPPPPPYCEEYYEEAPQRRGLSKRQRTLLIGGGCLLVLLACAAIIFFGVLIWYAPREFFEDPIRNFGSLFDILTMVLALP
jgi:predicted component of type VI protein secretion system